jgi:hypothetical protein
MKRKYMLAALLLVGLGIISTMAFSFDDSLMVSTDVYTASDQGATGNITRVRVTPIKGDLNKTRIQITMTGQDVGFDIAITLEDAVLTGITPASDLDVTTGTYDSTFSDPDAGHLEFTGCDNLGSGTGTWTLEIDANDATGLTASLWQDTSSLTIVVVDA